MYYSSGNYEAFAHPKKPEGVDHEKIAVKKALEFIKNTDVEKLLKEYHVI